MPQTQRMLTVNQAQYLACLPLLGRKPHKILSWPPWNHVFAGNSDFNMMLANGGSLYLDDGKPVGKSFERTLENLRMHPGTLAIDLPVAHALTVRAMRTDAGLRRGYFRDLDMFFYAGASLPADVWTAIEEMAAAEGGEAPLTISGWGMTETAPCAILYHQRGAASGMVGVPVPGLTAKLIPLGGERYELRVAGPNVIDGYFEDPERTEASFDEDGFFVTGDAVRFVDAADDSRGLAFDGRLTEDFKLITGTWVRASVLRVETLAALSGLVQDVVVVGEGRAEIGLLVFPAPGRCTGDADAGEALLDEPYAAELRAVLRELAAQATGSSMRIARAIVLAEPPSVGAGEITPKGSLNVRTVTRPARRSRGASLRRRRRRRDPASRAPINSDGKANSCPQRPASATSATSQPSSDRSARWGRGGPGRRRIIPIVGGRVTGPDISGRILNLGADWQTIFADGTAELDTRYGHGDR